MNMIFHFGAQKLSEKGDLWSAAAIFRKVGTVNIGATALDCRLYWALSEVLVFLKFSLDSSRIPNLRIIHVPQESAG